MKTETLKPGLLIRLGLLMATLLLGQQAYAVGTDAGLTVSNTTSVVYDVGGNTQPAVVSNQADFIVDRRVDFSLDADGAHEVVSPDGSAISFDFTLQNDSNSTMDFEITLLQLDPPGTVNGNDDTGAQVPSAVLATVYVDDILEDGNTVITVNAIADNTLSNGDIANIQVTAIARDPSGDSGNIIPLADTSASPDNSGVIDNVLANAGPVPGEESAGDGIIVQSAELVITKGYSVRWDPINLVDPNAKAIPGAVIEYLITIDNSAGAVAATDIVITDTIDALVQFVNAANNPEAPAEPYGGGTGNVDFGNGASECLADGDASDGCTISGADLTVAGSNLAGDPINVAAGATLEIRFRVLIPATP